MSNKVLQNRQRKWYKDRKFPEYEGVVRHMNDRHDNYQRQKKSWMKTRRQLAIERDKVKRELFG